MNFWEVALIVYGASILFMWLGFGYLLLWGQVYVKENNLKFKKDSTAALIASFIPCVVLSLIPLLNIVVGFMLFFSENMKQTFKQRLQEKAVK